MSRWYAENSDMNYPSEPETNASGRLVNSALSRVSSRGELESARRNYKSRLSRRHTRSKSTGSLGSVGSRRTHFYLPHKESSEGVVKSMHAEKNKIYSSALPSSYATFDKTMLLSQYQIELTASDQTMSMDSTTNSGARRMMNATTTTPSVYAIIDMSHAEEPKGFESTIANCPYCKQKIETVVKTEYKRSAFFTFLILFLLFIWPFCLIPLWLKKCQRPIHYCSSCQSKLSESIGKEKTSKKHSSAKELAKTPRSDITSF